MNIQITESQLKLIAEEYNNNILYGYHVTSKSNLESIRKNGFKIGTRQMQGRGFYSFYNLDHAIRYACKGEITAEGQPIVIKYTISPRHFLILNMDIAKKVFGDEYHLKDQIERYFKYSGGFNYFFEMVSRIKREEPYTIETLLEKLQFIEDNNDQMNQRIFWSYLIPAKMNDEMNFILDGYYGEEIRINTALHDAKLVGYHQYDCHGSEDYTHFSVVDKIPHTDEFLPLIEFIKEGRYEDYDLRGIENELEELMYKTKNNRDFNYFRNLLDLIGKVK